MIRRPRVPYRDVISGLKTGDLVFGRGRFWSSRIIEIMTGGTWSHVGMVVMPRDLGIDSDKPLLWEATSVPGHDIDLPKDDKKTGAMLLWLEERMTQYFDSGAYKLMGVRYLNTDRDDDFVNRMSRYVGDQAVRRTDYPEEYQILKDFLEKRYLTTVEQGTFFCSELVAATYQAIGLIPEKPHSQSYSPRDFSETGHLPLMLRSMLSKEVWLAAD